VSSYDVRVYHILANRNQRRTSHTVRWQVAGGRHRRTFATMALAESFRSKLIVAQREGVAFDETTGLPEPMARELNSRSWYEHAVAFVDMKWPRASGNHRKSIAESLATVTPALLATDRGRPADRDLRAALYGWAFNRARREAGPPPAQLANAVGWVRSNTVRLPVLVQDASRVRAALDALATLTDGRPAAANTVARKRAVFYGALQYAVELRMLERNPVDHIAWKAPESDGGVIDRKVVVNPDQARTLLAAVCGLMPELEAFFGCLYYAALRPEEALHLAADEYERPSRPGGWGWLHLTGATAASGGWGDGPGSREERGLKHRARGATRPVPAAPPLCDLLDAHLTRFSTGPGGRLFVLRRTATGRLIPGQPGPVSGNTYAAVWRRARQTALTPAQQRSPLARRPYDLRHAAVSTWLNAGVAAPQVAEWAGHSVHVLLKVYAKCIDGQEEAARRRIENALGIGPAVTDPG
jgi:integrase